MLHEPFIEKKKSAVQFSSARFDNWNEFGCFSATRSSRLGGFFFPNNSFIL